MRLTSIHEADIVKCDVRGVRFHAVVREKTPNGLRVKPIERGINHFEIGSRQVIEHFRRSRSGGKG